MIGFLSPQLGVEGSLLHAQTHRLLVAQLAVERRLVIHAHRRLKRTIGVPTADLRELHPRTDDELAVGGPVVGARTNGDGAQRIQRPGILHEALAAAAEQTQIGTQPQAAGIGHEISRVSKAVLVERVGNFFAAHFGSPAHGMVADGRPAAAGFGRENASRKKVAGVLELRANIALAYRLVEIGRSRVAVDVGERVGGLHVPELRLARNQR